MHQTHGGLGDRGVFTIHLEPMYQQDNLNILKSCTVLAEKRWQGMRRKNKLWGASGLHPRENASNCLQQWSVPGLGPPLRRAIALQGGTGKDYWWVLQQGNTNCHAFQLENTEYWLNTFQEISSTIRDKLSQLSQLLQLLQPGTRSP